MILFWMILILLAGALLCWASVAWNRKAPYFIAFITVLADLLLAIWLYAGQQQGQMFEDDIFPWIPEWGIKFHLRVDGLSIWLVLLTFFIGLVAIGSGDDEIKERRGFYYFNLLLTLCGVAGVFMAFDLFLFYFFWELMLVPMFCLIIIWGSENRRYAAYKFFIFTQAGGLCMLISILAFYFIHHSQSGNYSFDYLDWLHTTLNSTTQKWLMAGFLLAFLIKLPAFLVHTWLPDAHGEAPTAGSIILAGLLLKTGAYSLLRVVLPLFTDAVHLLAVPMMVWGMLGIVYGAFLSFAQTDLKRFIAYSSVSHMGFVLVGFFCQNLLGEQGVVILLIAHGCSTGALFALAGYIKHRLHHRDISRMGGLWQITPIMGFFTLLFTLASLGLPGMANFVAEFFILFGAFKKNALVASLSATGLILSAIYSLWLMQKIFFGTRENGGAVADLKWKEALVMVSLMIPLIYVGIHPAPLMDSTAPVLQQWALKGALYQKSQPITQNDLSDDEINDTRYITNEH